MTCDTGVGSPTLGVAQLKLVLRVHGLNYYGARILTDPSRLGTWFDLIEHLVVSRDLFVLGDVL